MYRKIDCGQIEFVNFYLPFSGRLRINNRWVVKASMIPWGKLEPLYEKNFSATGMGAPAKVFRIALGALLIKEELKITDEETVEQIRENPYLQYFIGYHAYTDSIPFDASMMTHFRKRLGYQDLQKINEIIVKNHLANPDKDQNQPSEPKTPESGNKAEENSGTLKVDATCAPADIRYPTDLSLLDEARRKSEEIIDIFYKADKQPASKPRTYRKIARSKFLAVIRKRMKTARQIRKAIGQQLRFLKRNLNIIDTYANPEKLNLLTREQYRTLLVIHEFYRQQYEMYENRVHRVDDRIVSIRQPHVRPIVRGKAGADVEFGAKISMSMIRGFVFIDNISFDAFNESGDLPQQIEAYNQRYGIYPKRVLADKIYQNRDNRAYCKKLGIELSGHKLGRPPKEELQKENKKRMRQDECERVEIEGGFGNLKRKYTWSEIRARLVDTSVAWIFIGAIMKNIDKAYRAFVYIFYVLFKTVLGMGRKPVFCH